MLSGRALVASLKTCVSISAEHRARSSMEYEIEPGHRVGEELAVVRRTRADDAAAPALAPDTRGKDSETVLFGPRPPPSQWAGVVPPRSVEK